MSSGITEQRQPGAGGLDIAYELDAEDHVAHLMWLNAGQSPSWSARLGVRFFLGLAGAVVLIVLPALAAAFAPTVDRLGQNALLFVSLFGVLLLLFLVTVPVSSGGLLGSGFAEERRAFWRAQVLDAVRNNVLRVGRRDRVSFDADGFLEVNEYREDEHGFTLWERKETRVPGALVAQVVVGDDHVFLVVAGKGNLIVPRRAFADEAALGAFVAAVRAWRRAAAPQGYVPADEQITGT